MFEDMVAAATWLKSRVDCTGKIGITDFCYGGGVSNSMAVGLGADLATAVPYYGSVPPADGIPQIKASILVHHGQLDAKAQASFDLNN